MRKFVFLAIVLSVPAHAEPDLAWTRNDGLPIASDSRRLHAFEMARSECQMAMQRENLSGPVGCEGERNCAQQAAERQQRVTMTGHLCMVAKGYKLVPK